jgi:hypothetical protein
MRFRKLRIAWSVVFAIAAVMLIVLWVRSYWWWDTVAKGWRPTPRQVLVLSSQSGDVIFHYWDIRRSAQTDFVRWKVTTLRSPDQDFFPVGGIAESYAGFYFIHSPSEFSLYVPDWFLVPLLILFATAPWMRWRTRFTTRTLLLATTAVAVVLGLIVWLNKR